MDVEFKDVRIVRGGRVVLDVARLRLGGARTTAILGPNGSGKTTLLRLIAGLERPRQGHVLLGGTPITTPPPVAFVFQEDVFLQQTVRQNLELGLTLRRIDKAERHRRIADAATLVGITHLLERRADRLSGGEGRRVSLARAFCLREPVVLLDEPLAGLDERTHTRLLDELPQLLAAFDATTLIVTHSRHEAMRLAQDLVVLVDGRVHAAGDKRAVATNPRVAEVADVLGYVILTANGRLIAVPPNALVPGAGRVSVSMVVDDVVDLVESVEIHGHVGTSRVRMTQPAGFESPAPGTAMCVHAERSFDLD